VTLLNSTDGIARDPNLRAGYTLEDDSHRKDTLRERPSFDRDRLRQVARLIHVRPTHDGDVVGEQL